MNTAGSSKWRKFSDYELRTADDGTRYICPVPGSAAVFYDPMAKPEKTAVPVLDAAEAHRREPDDETVLLDLVRLIGLPGLCYSSSGEYDFPFGGSPAKKSELLLAERGPEYEAVFSESYAEKYDDLCAWLKRISSFRSCSGSLTEEPDNSTLGSMAEYCIVLLSGEGKLHECAHCGKIYYTEDPKSSTCSKSCEFQYSISDPENFKRRCCRLIGGG